MRDANKNSDQLREWSLLYFNLDADDRASLRCEMIHRIVRAQHGGKEERDRRHRRYWIIESVVASSVAIIGTLEASALRGWHSATDGMLIGMSLGMGARAIQVAYIALKPVVIGG